MSRPRSLAWRLVPWLFPVALILVGLVFVATSLSGADRPGDIVSPPNVRNVTVANAAPWAQRQVLAGTTSAVTGVILASSSAESSVTYSVRAVIGRVDSPTIDSPTVDSATVDSATTTPDALARTVVTCVRWTVDVSSGTIVEHGANQLSNQPGRHEMGASDRLRSECRQATFAG